MFLFICSSYHTPNYFVQPHIFVDPSTNVIFLFISLFQLLISRISMSLTFSYLSSLLLASSLYVPILSLPFLPNHLSTNNTTRHDTTVRPASHEPRRLRGYRRRLRLHRALRLRPARRGAVLHGVRGAGGARRRLEAPPSVQKALPEVVRKHWHLVRICYLLF
jgi:hypothetical protein